MEITLFGAGKEVTGSCYSLVTSNEKILIDCGMFQGRKETVKKNYDDFGFEPKRYDALILTHAHLDHCGRIPRLVRYGFKGKIYCTSATKELAFIIMMDAAKIAFQDTEHENKRRKEQGLPPRKPLYNEEDVRNAMKLFKTIDYGEDIRITKNIIARYYDAGHILGASSVRVEVTEENKTTSIAFSGDLGQEHAILVRDIEPIRNADYSFLESTYGDRLHPPLDERKKEFLRVINETYDRGGKLMIPTFTVERAQEILYYLGEFFQEKLIPKIPVYLDSPMAQKATAVFTKYTDSYNEEVRNSLKKRKDLFNFPTLINTESVEESKAINEVKKPCIIIAGNGMCSAGRIKHHIKHNISDEKNTLLFIGYQAEGTLGYWIKQKEKNIRLLGTQVRVNAKIEAIDGFSAHADYEGLIEWLKDFKTKPKKVYICHGEEKQSLAFQKRIEKEGFNAYVPSEGEKIKL
jgi:metallo-beta-lactamase family protein